MHRSGDDLVQHRPQRLIGRRRHFDEERLTIGTASLDAVQHRTENPHDRATGHVSGKTIQIAGNLSVFFTVGILRLTGSDATR
ncbi:MAG: hypothetical protein ACYC4S_02930 [Rhodoferax sp.]